jgi:hypothetical protein
MLRYKFYAWLLLSFGSGYLVYAARINTDLHLLLKGLLIRDSQLFVESLAHLLIH